MVAVIGEGAAVAVGRVAAASSNVAAETVGQVPAGLTGWVQHLQEAWGKARRHALVYTLVDADPLGPVVEHWARRLAGEEHELELAIAAVGDAELPDYYLVDESLAAPTIDWYLGHLRSLAPSRVVPVTLGPGPLAARLGALDYGRPFPPGGEVAAAAREYVPLPGLGVVIEQAFD
jgi:hypothetical protein